MKKAKKPDNQIAIYQSSNGALELRRDIKRETIWATQAQIVKLFDIDQSVASRHIKNIFEDGEIGEKSNMQKMHIANSDKQVAFYSLDVILAVGYRTNSRNAIIFRKWATKILKDYILEGYIINRRHIKENYDAFLQAVADVKTLLPVGSAVDNDSILELITLFSNTWLLLDAYDKEKLVTKGATKKSVKLTADRLVEVIAILKSSFVEKNEASDFFAAEREQGNIAGIVGNVMQAFDGKELYLTAEEKAAHLFYFIIKDHPFVDGNKRSGAYAFIWFLRQAGILDTMLITPSALTALTLLIAESNPKYKDKMIRLVLTLLAQGGKRGKLKK